MRSSREKRRGAATPVIAIVLVLAAVAALAAVMYRPDRAGAASVDVFVVKRGDFDVTIPASGELAAERQEEVRNRLETRSTIMEIVPEGTYVTTGDVLLQLNDEEIRERIKDSDILVMDARNAFDNAVANLDLRRQERAAELKDADVQVELARLALKVWQEGEEISKRKGLELAIETAEKNFTRLEDVYANSVRLAESKFISLDEKRRDEIAMIEARARLEQARLDLMVYEKYQYEQDRKRLESELEQAVDLRARVEDEFDAKVRMAENDVAARESNLHAEEDRLEKYRRQLTYCVVTAPRDGLVVYASSLSEGRHGRNEGQPPQVGTELSRNELVMIIPDVSQMIAEIKVSESLSGLVHVGQRAVVTSDALPDTVLYGDVVGVGVLAQTGGWRDPNRRDYTVRIRLDASPTLGLKPSMRATANLYVGRVEDALYVPIPAVFRRGAAAYVYVPHQRGYAQRRIELGQASELYVEVLDGLEAGDIVLLREPRVEEIVSELDLPSGPRGPGGPGGEADSDVEHVLDGDAATGAAPATDGA